MTDENYILYVKEKSKVCEDALRLVSEVSPKIHLQFVENSFHVPSFVQGVPTLICMPSRRILTGSQIFQYMFDILQV